MLQDRPRFFHLPSAGNERIVESYCLACLRSVGASPSLSLLKILERAHHCMKADNAPRAAVTGPWSRTDNSGKGTTFESALGRSLRIRNIVVKDWQGVFIGRHDERGWIKEFKAHGASALCALGELVTAENNHLMRQAMLRMGNPIYTGRDGNIARFECFVKWHFGVAGVAEFTPDRMFGIHFWMYRNYLR